MYFTSEHVIHVKPSMFKVGQVIASLPSLERFLQGQKDLLPIADQVDIADQGTVKAFEITTADRPIRLVSKLVREGRVPSVFHEAYIGSILQDRGLHTPNVIAVCERKSALVDAKSYLIMERIPNALSLYQLYRKPVRLKEVLLAGGHDHLTKAQLIGFRKTLIQTFGAEVHKLFETGMIHAELDLKNVCVSLNPRMQLFFLDFERTRVTRRPWTRPLIVRSYKESVPRRLSRYRLSNQTKQLFTNGYINAGQQSSFTEIVTSVREAKQHSKAPYFIVAIDGFAGAGKTTLASLISTRLDNVIVLETDMFMRFSRIERESSLNRFVDHSSWYDLDSLSHLLMKLRRRASIHRVTMRSLYSHESGEKDITLRMKFEPGSTIVIEGMYSLANEVRRFCDLSVLLTASRDILLERVFDRDTRDRKIARSLVRKRFRVINGSSYKRFLQSHKSKADVYIDTSGKHDEASLLRVNHMLLPFFL